MQRVFLLAVVVGFTIKGLFAADSDLSPPEATFQAFKTAMGDKDYKKSLTYFTPKSQSAMVGGLSLSLSLTVLFDPASRPEAQKLLDKYGLKKLLPTDFKPGEDLFKAMQQVGAKVDDKPAYFAEVLAFLEKKSGAGSLNPLKDTANAKLTDVKIDGNRCTAKITATVAGQEQQKPFGFHKIDNRWQIDMSTWFQTGAEKK